MLALPLLAALQPACATKSTVPMQSYWLADQLLAATKQPTVNAFEVVVEVNLHTLAARSRQARDPKAMEFEWTIAGLGLWQAPSDAADPSVLALHLDAPGEQVRRDLVLPPQGQVGLRLHDRFLADSSCDESYCRRRYRITSTWFHASTFDPPTNHPLTVSWVVAGSFRRRPRGTPVALSPSDFRVIIQELEGTQRTRTSPAPEREATP